MTTNVLEVIQIVLIILKLCGLISWSWWWVMSPTIGGLAIALVILLIVIIFNKVTSK